MKIELYKDNEEIVAGMTLRDDKEAESGNMALHICISRDNAIENRNKLAAHLGCDLGCFVCPEQTHSENFYQATFADKGRGAYELNSAIPDTDALYTYEPGILLCCFTADCVPVIFYNKAAGLVGVIHSGWQGTVKEISLKVFRHLIRQESCDPQDFEVYVGKALSQERFEVDDDVYRSFDDLGYTQPFISFNSRTGKYHIDNQLTVKKQCELAGIPSEKISLDRTCTYNDPDCFSYRRDPACGRHMSFIMRKSGIKF
ncbi:MAG: peptidoglycan editing factor PgeF [Clostridiaceae bacterium]|jgi:YfiH family protein|nr:peptidoglycan editing factor PgeF [Clostridiaceae bacterium]